MALLRGRKASYPSQSQSTASPTLGVGLTDPVGAKSDTFLQAMDRFSAQRIVPLGADAQHDSNACELTEVGVPTRALIHNPGKAEHDEHLL